MSAFIKSSACQPHQSIGLVSTFICCLLLCACQGSQGDDLDQFMANAGKGMSTRIKPIPEVKPYVPIEFNADGMLRDPFKLRKANTNQSGNLQPNFKRRKEALENFALETLKFVGVITKPKLKFALIQPPDGSVQQVKIGNYIGQNFGLVTDITESSVVVKEIVQDDATGDWVERTSSIDLQE